MLGVNSLATHGSHLLWPSVQVAATRRLATMTAPRMTFPGPKRISGLVRGSCLLYCSFNHSEQLRKRVMCLSEGGMVAAIRSKSAGGKGQGLELRERE